MRRVEIKNRDSVLPCRIFNYLGEDENKIFCKDDLGRVHILNKKLVDMRFLDPPEEKPNNLDSINSRQNEIEHKLDSLENENGRLTKRIEALEELCKDGDLYKVKALDINYGDLSCGFNELTKKVEKLEMAVDFCRITPTLKGDLEHVCQYSKTMDQPYPRKCVVCGKEEHPYPKEKKDYLFDYDGVIAAFRSAVEKDRRHGTGYLKESTFAQELLHTPIVQPQPTFTIDRLVDILKDEDFIRNVCASYDHSFGLLTEQQRQQQMFNCREYLHAITNNLPYHEVKPTYTREEVEKAIDAALISINMFGVPRLKSSILSELDKVKEDK